MSRARQPIDWSVNQPKSVISRAAQRAPDQEAPNLKIAVLVKEVPDAAVDKRINPETKRLDRSGEKNLNPFDTHALEAAMQVKEGGAIPVEEVVAGTKGPGSGVRALPKGVAPRAPRPVPPPPPAPARPPGCPNRHPPAQG